MMKGIMDNTNFFKTKFGMISIALLCCALWGSAFPSVKMLYSLTPIDNIYQRMMLAGVRFASAGILVLLFSKFQQKKSIRVKPQNIKYIVIIALLQTFFAYSFYYIGLSNTTGVRASIIVSVGIFNVAIMSVFAFKDFRLTSGKILGMIISLGGVLLINLNVFSGGAGLKLTGEGFILITTLFTALASIFIKKYAAKMDVVLLNGYQLLVGGALMMAVAYAGYPHFIPLSAGIIILLIYMSVMSAIAFSLWYVLLEHNDVAAVTLYKSTIPIFGSMLSILFLPDENFVWILIPSLFLTAIGIIIFSRVPNRKLNNT